MEICKNGHKEICFDDGWYCPVCELMEDVEQLKQQITKMEVIKNGCVKNIKE